MGKTPACAILLESISIKKVIIGTLDPNQIAKGGKQRLENAKIDVEVIDDKNCENLLLPFIRWQQNSFKFFKIAMREDGSIDGGYITTQDSLNLVHKIRTKIDLMVIGGETVRVDRPTLDTRFAQINKAPDIMIYTKSITIDTTIPLFNVKNREVTLNNDFNITKQYKFVMVEGGYNLLHNIKEEIDCLMIFISHKEKKNKQYEMKISGFKKVYSYMLNQIDEVVYWFKLS
jgi:diaminohydroxyphosphoribosylaminopyrimidine deaminase/5-amino-6-(5-phosphoribosylamino)uracil reductase